MYSSINKKNQVDSTSNSKGRSRYSNIGINDSNFRYRNHLDGIQVTESIIGSHFEMKIDGYIKEDFNYYVANNILVITTAKDIKSNKVTATSKHSYCYPSALFKKIFHLPDDVQIDMIEVDYKNHILSIDLFKSNTKSNS